MFTGTYTAIVTPFFKGVIDEDALERLIKMQIKGGVDGIVPVGTTGESPTVNCEEHIRIIELSVKFAAGKIKVLAGTGANATSEAIELTRAAEKVGADVDEFTFRFNRRAGAMQNIFSDVVNRVSESEQLPYKTLIQKPA